MRLLNSDNVRTSYFTVLLGAVVFYIATCAPTVLWQDSGMFQYRIWHNDIEGNLGLALSHPLYHIIGIIVKKIPFGDFAYRVNLISAVAAAVTVANLFLLLRLWLGKNLPALLAAITLALSWTFWQFAAIAEVYTLYTALFLAELVMLFWYVKTEGIGFLYLLALFNGLAIANHMWGVIALACYLAFLITLLLRKQINLSHLGIAAALWIIGAAPYEYLIVKDFIQTGDFAATMTSAFFGTWQKSVLNTTLPTKLIRENLIFIAYNFPTPNIIFFFAGLYSLRKLSSNRSFANILLALLILFFVFAFRYTVADRYAFFIPFYCLVSALIGAGVDLVIVQPGRKILCWAVFIFAMLPIPIYIITPAAAEKMQFKLPAKRDIPYRNNYTWFLQPWQSCYNGPERFAKEALECVESEAIIIADGTTVYPLWYVQTVKGVNPAVKIVAQHGSYQNPIAFPTEDTIAQLMAGHPVYVVSPVAGYCPNFILERYDFIQAGVLWWVVEREKE